MLAVENCKPSDSAAVPSAYRPDSASASDSTSPSARRLTVRPPWISAVASTVSGDECAHDTATDAANRLAFLPGSCPCSSREVSVDMPAVELAAEVMLIDATFDLNAVRNLDRGGRIGLRIAEAEELALGLRTGVGAGRGVDADHVVGQDLRTVADRDLRLGGLDQHLDGQRDEILQETHGRVEEELRLQRGQAQRVGQCAVFGLGHQVDVAGAQRGVGADVDRDTLGQVARGQQVLDLRRADAAGAEDDVVAAG